MSKNLAYLLPLILFLPLIYGSQYNLTVDRPEVTRDQVKLSVTYTFDLEPDLNVTKWSQRSSNRQITVPWSTFNFTGDKLEELITAMASMEREVSCMRFPYITQQSLNSTEWARGVIFSWNDQGPCNSALGVEPGVGMKDIEVKFWCLSIFFSKRQKLN